MKPHLKILDLSTNLYSKKYMNRLTIMYKRVFNEIESLVQSAFKFSGGVVNSIVFCTSKIILQIL